YELLAEAFKNCVGPAKTGLSGVNTFGRRLLRLDDVVLFQEDSVAVVPVKVGLEPFHSDSLGLLVIAVTLESFYHDEVQRRPAVRVCPLRRDGARYILSYLQGVGGGQAAFFFE